MGIIKHNYTFLKGAIFSSGIVHERFSLPIRFNMIIQIYI